MTRALVALGVVVVALAGCITQQTGDFALCCTCLAQKSPVNDGNAVTPAENCLPDASDAGPGEVDQCDQEAADFIADPGGDHPIHVVDELCGSATCQQECNGAGLDGAKFVVVEQSLTQ